MSRGMSLYDGGGESVYEPQRCTPQDLLQEFLMLRHELEQTRKARDLAQRMRDEAVRQAEARIAELELELAVATARR